MPPQPVATSVRTSAKPVNRAQLRIAGLVAAAWLVVLLAYAAGLAVVLPPLLLVAVAALLRGGRTLLDRLMLATGLLLGLTCLGGLIFAVWPWGMHPIAVGGTAFTVLILVAARCDRRPALPRPRSTDALAALATTVVGVVVARPVLRAGPAERLAIMLDGEDLARHGALFDAIRRTGGYLFQQHDQAERLVYDGMITYPQGSHLLAGLLDGFVRSSSHDFGGGTGMLTHYLAYALGGYVLLTLTLVWAAQWAGAGALTPARQLPLAAFVAGMCGAGELLELLSFGYPSQVVGLAEAVLLLALLVRPLARTRQQLLLVAALLVAVGFTYYLYLPPVGLAALIWLVRERRRVRRHRAVLGLAAALAAVSAGPMALGLLLADQAGALFTIGYLALSRDALIALGCLVASGLLARRGRRSRIWRAYTLVFLPVAAFAGALLVAQRLFGAGSGYYANKALFLVFALLLVGSGAVALHLPAPARRPLGPRSLLPAVPVLLAIVVLVGAGRGDSPYRPREGGTWGQQRLKAADAEGTARARTVLAAYERFPAWSPGRPAVPVLVVGDDRGYDSYRMTLFLATLQRTSGETAGAIYNHLPVTAPDRLDASVERMPGPMRLLVLSDAAERRAVDVRDRHPHLPIEVVRVQR